LRASERAPSTPGAASSFIARSLARPLCRYGPLHEITLNAQHTLANLLVNGAQQPQQPATPQYVLAGRAVAIQAPPPWHTRYYKQHKQHKARAL